MSLVLCDSLDVKTEQGTSSIELYIGSVTKAKAGVPFDVLVISSFPGDYTPTRTSVIGALKYDLNVNVGKLSQDKEKDYRKHFSCWWSKELDSGLGFKRILCFEGSFKQNLRPPSTVGEVFRSLVTLCEDTNARSVMMPLLSTGDQSYSKEMMLRLIIEASIHWMQIGLPLKKLGIIVYQKETTKINKWNKNLVEFFASLKSTWLQIESSRILKDSQFLYDYYVASSPEDEEVVERIKSCLKSSYKDCTIYHEKQEIDSEKSWQDHIYDVMVKCSRVLVVLSPNFLQDSSCIEKFNLAICCSRNLNHNYLAPLYASELVEMPTYMGLIQYIDITPLTDDCINEACRSIPSLRKTFTIKQDSDNEVKEKEISLVSSFDVFISYSHRNYKAAKMIFDHITKCKPHWSVFFDQASLKAGNSWQTKLYQSIESSKTVLVLLSNAYLESKVCQEEYNLAKCLFDDNNYKTQMVEVKVEHIRTFPSWCAPERVIDLVKMSQMKLREIVGHLDQDKGFWDYSHNSNKPVIIIDTITSIWRQEFAKANFPILPKFNTPKDVVQSHKDKYTTPSKADIYDVVVVFHESQASFASLLKEEFSKYSDCLKCLTIHNDSLDSWNHHIFDKSKIVVPLLSKEYYQTPLLMEYFNTALSRHRFSEEIVIFPIMVGKLPTQPVYPRISFCLFSTEDSCWTKAKKDPKLQCLTRAAIVITSLLTQCPKSTTSFKTLLSMRELEEWAFCKTRGKSRVKMSPLLFASLDESVNTDSKDSKRSPNQETTEADLSFMNSNGGHSIRNISGLLDESSEIAVDGKSSKTEAGDDKSAEIGVAKTCIEGEVKSENSNTKKRHKNFSKSCQLC